MKNRRNSSRIRWLSRGTQGLSLLSGISISCGINLALFLSVFAGSCCFGAFFSCENSEMFLILFLFYRRSANIWRTRDRTATGRKTSLTMVPAKELFPLDPTARTTSRWTLWNADAEKKGDLTNRLKKMSRGNSLQPVLSFLVRATFLRAGESVWNWLDFDDGSARRKGANASGSRSLARSIGAPKSRSVTLATMTTSTVSTTTTITGKRNLSGTVSLKNKSDFSEKIIDFLSLLSRHQLKLNERLFLLNDSKNLR